MVRNECARGKMRRNILISALYLLVILCHSYETLKLDYENSYFYGNTTLGRYRRQASNRCKTDPMKFQCETTPDCIESDLECNGKENCPDGSDEKKSLCERITCPSYLFRCDYGACVDGDSRCDGKKDCKDNSDEEGCVSSLPKQNTNCRSDEFECADGQCIEADGRCNGKTECKDQSDETERLCLNIMCPGYTYKCKYGACVDGDAECNGIKECYDNSDEDENTCGPKTPAPDVDTKGPVTGRQCVTPPQPENGEWTILNAKNIEPVSGQVVPVETAMKFVCDSGYQLSTTSTDDEELIYCRKDHQWSFTEFPRCLLLCPKLYSQDHAILECSLEGSKIPCHRATAGTQLKYTCDPYFEADTSTYNFCQNGEWSYPHPRCKTKCGQKQVGSERLVIHGTTVKVGHYPWVVALYSYKDTGKPTVFENICGGSLLTTSIVLTAAHCVSEESNGKIYHRKFFRVAAGKHYRDFNANENGTAQVLKVKIIFKHEEYLGQIQNFRHDIALLKLEGTFALSKTVQPVCYDKSMSLLVSRGIATVTGWGFTTSSGTPADELQEIDLEYVENDVCRNELDMDFADQYLVSDKLCAGFVNRSMGVCKGDSGGGLVVRHTNGRFFIEGVVSLAKSFYLNNQQHCDIQRRALFTRVNPYIIWILKNIPKLSIMN